MPNNNDNTTKSRTYGQPNPNVIWGPKALTAADVFTNNPVKSSAEVNRLGDGPPVFSQAAETLKPGAQPGDPPPKKKKILKEGAAEEAIYRYLHKRRMNWFYRIDEGTPLRTFVEKLDDFANYAASYLDLNEIPSISLNPTEKGSSFASWSPDGIELCVTNRHPMDVFRSLAHELVHHKQHEDDVLHNESGETGSEHENEANALAGIMMRNYAKVNPDMFELEYIEEGFWKSLGKAVFSNVDRTSKEPTQQRQQKQTPSSSTQKIERRPISLSLPDKKNLTVKDKNEVIDQYYKKDQDETERILNLPHVKARIAKNRAAKEASKRSEQTSQHQKWLSANKTMKEKYPKTAKGGTAKPFKGLLRSVKESICLLNKASKTNIDYEILSEVFDRGLSAWTPDQKIDPKQFAFNRVNSFIAGGKAKELDSDLTGEKR